MKGMERAIAFDSGSLKETRMLSCSSAMTMKILRPTFSARWPHGKSSVTSGRAMPARRSAFSASGNVRGVFTAGRIAAGRRPVPNVRRQGRAQRSGASPLHAGVRCGVRKREAGRWSWSEGTVGKRDRVGPCSGRRWRALKNGRPEIRRARAEEPR